MTRCDGLLQRRIAIAIGAVNFELLQINRQLPKSKMRHPARRKIVSHTALRLRPVHIIGMLLSHGWRSVARRSTAILAVAPQASCLPLDGLDAASPPKKG